MEAPCVTSSQDIQDILKLALLHLMYQNNCRYHSMHFMFFPSLKARSHMTLFDRQLYTAKNSLTASPVAHVHTHRQAVTYYY